jgi:hypothetical protein
MNVKKTTIGTKASHLRIGLLYPAAEREQFGISKLFLIETVSDLFSRTAEKRSSPKLRRAGKEPGPN